MSDWQDRPNSDPMDFTDSEIADLIGKIFSDDVDDGPDFDATDPIFSEDDEC